MGGDLIEAKRLDALRALDILDSARDPDLDQVVGLAAGLFGVPVALLTITAESRNWFKARFGTELPESPRDISFCTWAIGGESLFEVPDCTRDARFAANPLVTGPANIRYYAGMPIRIAGHAIGTLCLLDTAPRPPLDDLARQRLADLAALVMTLIEARRLRRFGALSMAVAQATPDAIICAGTDGLITQWNRGAEAIFGYSAREAIGQPLELIVPAALRDPHGTGMTRFKRTGEGKQVGATVEVPAMRKDGTEVPVELSLASWQDADGRPAGFGAILRELTARKAEEEQRAAAQRFADEVCQNLPATLFVKDAATLRYMLFNRAGETLTGVPSDEIVGRTDAEIWPDMAAGYTERDTRVIETGVSESFESEVTRRDGRTRIMRTRRVLVHDEAGAPAYILGIGEDVTEWRRAQQQLAYAAGHDALTGLYNRDHFLWALEAALAQQCAPGQRPSGEVALLALDLDRFSSIVDMFGRTASDALLVDVATKVRLALKPGACAARFDADRFFIMLIGPGAPNRAEALARELLGGLATPGKEERRPQARARIGIAAAPRDGLSGEALIASAELAALRAKSVAALPAPGATPGAAGWRIGFFERSQNEAAKRRRRVEERLIRAVADGEIDVHYQPLVELRSGRTAGYEALARWRDAELGVVSPVEFIPVAEANGLIAKLGALVLGKAAREAVGWDDETRLSVNFSAAQFADLGLFDAVEATLAGAGFDPERLEVEITESLLIAPHERVLDTLRRFKAMGATIAMDDFGTGYSSLSYFCSFPFDKVKIDQSFVRDMTTKREARAIVRAVIGLAHGIGMTVVGEGVETQDQLDALTVEGCDLAQGFLIGRPAASAGRASSPPLTLVGKRSAAAG
ncbi:MAG TPA: EAL domain-containing protein [Sphingomonadaceae bacterium]|nr:EAL domain-containing protein [Sphingomonadaceae bacterium]